MAVAVSPNGVINYAGVNMDNAAYCVLQEELEKGTK